ncbi:ARS binding protein 2-domain-containing protein [Podospora appendiculata]|uniref:ARS binding protein 2-domain-containing protein n=1 Tax=Podospora appendiculata TaxID=314037 RepID=A0AAE0X362_9PEZI|nr:ARS binding protein 2-domain-containing protein [Podospora appendiculata]
MQRPPQTVLTASPPSIHPPSAISPPTQRPPLPARNVVDSASIEDAFVNFVLHCNPAVPPETDSAALREAFRTPPKSGGKTFSTYTLFELIKQLDTKELKTWAELALKLGVEPPDQEKGQSSQKIQQYAVRLKRWMHSMHVDAFFEYLMDRPHPYWTEIPSDQTPIAESGRDGVAAEDDMALRALLPQIKPRRGRKRPEDDETPKSPPADEFSGMRHEGMEPWSAHPDGRGSVFLFPTPTDPLRLGVPTGQPPGSSWTNQDIVQTPLTAYPQIHSAITPSTRNAFWADPLEPRSAITASKPRTMSRRHGAKVVSSAWRSSGGSGTGKTRGRPPINRGGNIDGPFSAFPSTSDGPVFKIPSPTPERGPIPPSSATPTLSIPPSPILLPPAPPSSSTQSTQSPILQSPAQESSNPRPAKRSRLSLQVPARVGGEVRLATPPLPPPLPTPPPPVVMVNGLAAHQQDDEHTPLPSENDHLPSIPSPPISTSHAGGPQTAPVNNANNPFNPSIVTPSSVTNGLPPPPQNPLVSFQDETDRTNVDEIEGFFVHDILMGSWFDDQGNGIPPCGVDEAWGLARTVIENLMKVAATKEAFLINLAALAGGKLLMSKDGLKVTKLATAEKDRSRYKCEWELRVGDIRGGYAMEETVLHERWRRKEEEEEEEEEGVGEEGLTAQQWQQRYKEMAGMVKKRDQELARLRVSVVEALKVSEGEK